MPKQEEEAGNLFRILLEQAENLDLTDPDIPKDEQKDPGAIMIPGLEVSKLFAIVEFGLLHAKDEDGILAGLDMMTREQAIKAINGTFQFIVKPSEGSGIQDKELRFYVDMRRSGEIRAGPAPTKPKPDVTMSISDKDMIQLALGKMNPQMAFMKGKVKVKGNIMLGLRMQTVLMNEVGKMQRASKL